VSIAYLIVVVMSLLVGSVAYLATLRAGREGPVAVGFDAGEGEPEVRVEPPGAGFTYLRVATRGPTWRDRLQGVIGLVLLLFFATAALAYGLYELGHAVNLTISRFFE
jgi:hypothetical protein